MIKLACFSDTHGKAPGEIGPDYNAVLHAGDAYSHLRLGHSGSFFEKKGDPNDFDAMSKWHKKLGCPLYSVRGNHDVCDPIGFFVTDITEKAQKLTDTLYVVGIGWHGQNFFDLPRERDMQRVVVATLTNAAEVIPDGSKIVLLTHFPAATREIVGDSNPEGWLFDCVRDTIDVLNPVLCIAGHIHEMFGKGYVYKAMGCPVLFPGPKGIGVEIHHDGRVRTVGSPVGPTS